MSDLLPLFDDDDDGSRDRVDRNDRRQSIWTLLVVGAFAVTVAVLATLLLQSPSSTKKPDNQLAGPSQPVASRTAPSVAIVVTTQSASTVPRTSATPSTSVSTSASKSASTSASRSPSTSPTAPKTSASRTHPTPTPTHSTSSTPPPTGPCPTRMPCVVDGGGGAVAAMQARVGKPGSVDSAAQTCALNEIEDLDCAGAHSTITEPSQDGAQAVADLLPPGADLGWLGERSTLRFGVGWAYDPKSQQYLCAFVKNGLPPPTSPTLDSRS